jgi:hypothetical protein
MNTLAQYAVGIAASAALLVGCGGGSQYVSNGNSGNVSAFAINASSGALTPLKSSPFAAGSYAFPRHAYVSACNGRRNGVAQCGVIVRSTGVRADTPSGWSPADLQSAYKLPSSTKGKGQIVAIVDAYDNPDAASDLAEYRSTFGLPKATFAKYNQEGQRGNYPEGNPGWGVEIDLDVEMASASCPYCTIYLIEANSNKWSDLEAAESEAVTLGAHIVSNSFSGSGASESYFDSPGVPYLAMSGNSGYGLYDPAAFASVAAVGGTVLSRGGRNRGWAETVWPDAGGGCVAGGGKPRWQHDKYAKGCDGRTGSDVSAVAEGVAEYDGYDYGGWLTVNGTNIGAPFLAGVLALAGNATRQDGGRTFWLTAHRRYLYRVTQNDNYVRFSYGGGWGTPDGIGAF